MHVTKDTMTLTRDELRALLAHAGKDDTRAHLWGVAVDLTLGRAFATDGHRACIAQARSTPSVTATIEPCVAPRDVLERAIKACGTGGRIALRRYGMSDATAGASPALGAGASYLAVEVLDAHEHTLMTAHAKIDPALRPPPVDAVFPPADPSVPRIAWTTVDPAFLRDLALVASAAEAAGVRCWGGTAPLDPILHDVDGPEAHWRIVVMPMRGDEPPKAVPAVEVREQSGVAVLATHAEGEPPAPAPAAPKRRSRKGGAATA